MDLTVISIRLASSFERLNSWRTASIEKAILRTLVGFLVQIFPLPVRMVSSSPVFNFSHSGLTRNIVSLETF